ncbi:hypothetical protein Bbelb_198760 [Branchiostoma belcheri]|nr:hypothetical protein Bbelb_198760 [Branchiostoma belcheri]
MKKGSIFKFSSRAQPASEAGAAGGGGPEAGAAGGGGSGDATGSTVSEDPAADVDDAPPEEGEGSAKKQKLTGRVKWVPDFGWGGKRQWKERDGLHLPITCPRHCPYVTPHITRKQTSTWQVEYVSVFYHSQCYCVLHTKLMPYKVADELCDDHEGPGRHLD